MNIDFESAVLMGVIGAMVLNQLVMRLGGLRGNVYLFWSLQMVNIAVASALILFGLPGFEKWPIVAWMIALLFVFRTVQNTQQRTVFLRERRAERNAEELAKQQAIRAALKSE